MNNKKIERKRIIIKISVLIICTALLAFLWNFHSKGNTESSLRQESKTASVSKSESPINIYTLSESPFSNSEEVNYINTSLDNLSKSKKPKIVLSPTAFLKDENKEIFNTLAEKGYTIIFYGKEITAEKVVLFFDGRIPVVPIESTIPLKFQGYGITSLNKTQIPVFVSATSDQSTLNEDSFIALFKQISL